MQDYVTNIDEGDGSVAFNIFLITFFIYGRCDSCSRADTHGAKVFPGLINKNIITSDIIDKY